MPTLLAACGGGEATAGGQRDDRPLVVDRLQHPRLDDGAARAARCCVLGVGFRGSGVSCRLQVDGLTEPLEVGLPAEAGTPPVLGSAVDVACDESSVCLQPRKPE